LTEFTSLITLKPGEKGIINNISDQKYTSKLMTLGILPGVGISIIRYAPFGGALYVQLPNHQIALRSEEAASIIVIRS